MKKTNIAFSITAHESVDCLHDLIMNIYTCFSEYHVVILLSLTDSLFHSFLPAHTTTGPRSPAMGMQHESYPSVTVVSVRPDTQGIWGTVHLFHEHMLAVRHLVSKNIQVDYFWFVASNEMFIDKVPGTFLEEYYCFPEEKKAAVREEEIKAHDSYFENFLRNKQLYWREEAKKDVHFMEYCSRRKYVIHYGYHEGLVIEQDIMKQMYREYCDEQIHEKCTFGGYTMEEIFPLTFLYNNYSLKKPLVSFCLNKAWSPMTFQKFMSQRQPWHLSFKRVPRTYDDPLRVQIRQYSGTPSQVLRSP